jgi:hypothetical protein
MCLCVRPSVLLLTHSDTRYGAVGCEQQTAAHIHGGTMVTHHRHQLQQGSPGWMIWRTACTACRRAERQRGSWQQPHPIHHPRHTTYMHKMAECGTLLRWCSSMTARSAEIREWCGARTGTHCAVFGTVCIGINRRKGSHVQQCVGAALGRQRGLCCCRGPHARWAHAIHIAAASEAGRQAGRQ